MLCSLSSPALSWKIPELCRWLEQISILYQKNMHWEIMRQEELRYFLQVSLSRWHRREWLFFFLAMSPLIPLQSSDFLTLVFSQFYLPCVILPALWMEKGKKSVYDNNYILVGPSVSNLSYLPWSCCRYPFHFRWSLVLCLSELPVILWALWIRCVKQFFLV